MLIKLWSERLVLWGFFFYQVTGNEEVDGPIPSPVSWRNSSNICLKKLVEAGGKIPAVTASAGPPTYKDEDEAGGQMLSSRTAPHTSQIA